MTDNNDNFDSTDDADKRLLVELLYGERSLESEEVSSASASRTSASGSSASIKSDALEGELETMRGLRALFAELPDEEPPAALTAQLMHAAAMHAKKAPAAVASEESGFFARLRDWFMPVLNHPGLAAAATLVVVAGVAGSLYMRGEGKVAEPQAASGASAPSEEGARRDVLGRANFAQGDSADMPAAAAPDDGVLAESEADPNTGLIGGKFEEEKFSGNDRGERSARDTVAKDNLAIGSTGRGGAPQGGVLDSTVVTGKAADSRNRGVASNEDSSGGGGWAQPPTSTAPGSKTGGGAKGKATSTIAVDLADELRPLEPSQIAGEDDDAYGDSEEIAEQKPAAKTPAKKTAPTKPVAAPQPAPAPPADKAPEAEAPKAGASKDSEVRSLHGRAVDAASRNDCNTVLKLANDIRKLDGAYYDKAFRSDKRLTTCLSKQSAPVKK